MGERTEIAPFTMVGENVRLGSACRIGAFVLLHPGTRLGHRCRVDAHVEIGKEPMKATRSTLVVPPDLPPPSLGNDILVGSGAVIYQGARIADRVMIADGATVREGVSIGAETIIGRGVLIEQACQIGKGCKIESGAYITAFSTIEEGCFIAPMVAFSNDRHLGRTKRRLREFQGPILRKGARIGVNATILPGIEIGEDALVAAGAVVTRDVPPRTIVVGVPARIHGAVPEEAWLENQSRGEDA